MLISLSKQKDETFDFYGDVHSKLVDRFKNEVNGSQPLHLKTINGFLGRIYHFDKDTIKIIVNDLAKKGLIEIRKGSGISNYFIVIRREVRDEA